MRGRIRIENCKCSEVTTIEIPKDILEQAGFDDEQMVRIECEEGKITINNDSILNYLPEELLEDFEELDIPKAVVESVLLREYPWINDVLNEVCSER